MSTPPRAAGHFGFIRAVRSFARRHHAVPTLDRATDRTRDAFSLAQDEARRLGHESIGTAHMVLGILRRQDSVGALMLSGRDVELRAVRAAVERAVGRGTASSAGERGVTPRLKRILALSDSEARRLHHDYLGTEHLLLAILREGEGVGARILRDRGITIDMLQADLHRIVG